MSATQADALVEVTGLAKAFASPDAAGGATSILSGLDFRLGAGEAVAIVGPSGSGKSTFLNVIGALDGADAGRVVIGGQDLAGLDEVALARIRADEIGFVFQQHHLLPQLTALENVLVPTVVATDRDGTEDRARTLLERVGLGARMTHRPGQLSGGECQRVAVVRALINRPSLLLADEPTGSLDRESAASLTELLCELNREERVALVVVTHAPELAARIGRTLTLRDGRLEDA